MRVNAIFICFERVITVGDLQHLRCILRQIRLVGLTLRAIVLRALGLVAGCDFFALVRRDADFVALVGVEGNGLAVLLFCATHGHGHVYGVGASFCVIVQAGDQVYRNQKIDAVTELPNSQWCAFELKLGANQIDAAVENLLEIQKQSEVDPKSKPPALLCVLCGTANAAYQRADGVFVRQ